MQTSFGSFRLHRFPKASAKPGKQQPLRAWDAADEYLLESVYEQLANHDKKSPQILILNDSFGALAVSLHQYRRFWQSDSFMAQAGCQQNLSDNDSDGQSATESSLTLLDSLHWPDSSIDMVLIKIPKTSALLEHQLYQLRQIIHPATQIIAAGMTKSIHTNTLKIFEKVLGTTTTSLARKKARLIFCQPEPDSWRGQSPYPTHYRLKASDLPEAQRLSLEFVIHNHANVFSRASLDIGTRLFLQHLPQIDGAKDIIDLGCGNGLLGIAAAKNHPDARVHFVDESFMAVDSARQNVDSALSTGENCIFKVGNSLADYPSESADVILNNPPFHQQSVVGDHIAWQMFNDAKRVLKSGGRLWVIGNRHLSYHTKLQRLFGHCRTVASDQKFVVLEAKKR